MWRFEKHIHVTLRVCYVLTVVTSTIITTIGNAARRIRNDVDGNDVCVL